MNANEGKNETKATEKTEDSVPAAEAQGANGTVEVTRKLMLDLVHALNRAGEKLKANAEAARATTEAKAPEFTCFRCRDTHGLARTDTPGAVKRFLDLGNGERISMDQVVEYRVDECAPPCVTLIMANKDWKSTCAPRGIDRKAAAQWLDELFGARPLWK